jgi:ABC-type sugar transport system substrate-binding protein
VKKANKAGIPVFMLGRTCSGGKVVLSSRADNVSLGTFAAEEVVRRLKAKYGEAKGLVLEIQGEMASTNARIRSESINAVFKKYPKIKVISKPTHWLDSEFHDITKSVAAANPDLAAITMGSDVIYGVDAALKSLGKLKPIGDPKHIIIVGIDADPRILGLIKQGLWDASALQDAVGYGTILAQRMAELLAGKFEIKTTEFVLKDYDLKKHRFMSMRGLISNPGKPDDGVPIYRTEQPDGWELMTPSRIIDKSNADDPDLWGNMIKQFQ